MSTAIGKHQRDELWVCQLGIVSYLDALAIQERVRAARQARELPDTLLLLEHPPVYTRGRRSADADLPFPEDFYRAKGIEVIATRRGGRITYHGPGQLVGYPIMAVTDVWRFVRTMEGAIVVALAQEGVQGHARVQDGPDYTGVWVQDRKIASIGVHVSRGVSAHGFAVNVDNDLEPFSWVVACGLPGVCMTSLAHERQASAKRDGQSPPDVDLDRFRQDMARSFCRAHARRWRPASPAELGIEQGLPGLEREQALPDVPMRGRVQARVAT